MKHISAYRSLNMNDTNFIFACCSTHSIIRLYGIPPKSQLIHLHHCFACIILSYYDIFNHFKIRLSLLKHMSSGKPYEAHFARKHFVGRKWIDNFPTASIWSPWIEGFFNSGKPIVYFKKNKLACTVSMKATIRQMKIQKFKGDAFLRFTWSTNSSFDSVKIMHHMKTELLLDLAYINERQSACVDVTKGRSGSTMNLR